jgi:CheY-like chemotaxis protein
MKKVLVAEDNAVNRELLREMLEAVHCEVVEASDGKEALARMEDSNPDLILLDINMPGLDGFAVVKQIRQHQTFSRIPVLAVTAYAMSEDKERVFQSGFNGYLAKPIDTKLLAQELKRFAII